MTLYGIDVSNHQGNFDFAAAKREGFAFATHKVTESDDYKDPYWPRAREQMREHFAGRFGGYHFYRRGADVNRQADLLASHIGDLSIPVQLDFEDTAGGGSADDMFAMIRAIEARGMRVFANYVPRWFWEGRMASKSMLGSPPLWSSSYGSNPSGFASSIYPGDDGVGWRSYGDVDVAIWQFGEHGRVAGQSIDVNAFRGDDEQLAALFGAATPEKEFDMAGEAAAVAGQFFGPDGKGFDILGHAVETDPSRKRFLTEAVGVILTQLTGGPNFEGWEQLGDGKGSAVERRTLVDGIAHVKNQNDEIIALLKAGK